MDEITKAFQGDIIKIMDGMTLLLLAFLYSEIRKLRAGQKENGAKIEETRENVSRVVNGHGVAHDHERATQSLKEQKVELAKPPDQVEANDRQSEARQASPATGQE